MCIKFLVVIRFLQKCLLGKEKNKATKKIETNSIKMQKISNLFVNR